MMNMLAPDKKNLASLIVEGPKVEKVSDNETDYSAGMDAAAKDIADAIEKKDTKLLLSGLKDLFAMLMDEHESGPVEEEEEESEEEKKPGWK